MKMKVVHLLSHLKMGGAETLVTQYALNLNKEKYEVIIITLQKSNNSINEQLLSDNGIRVFCLGDLVLYPKGDSIFKRLINKIHKHFLFSKIIKKENIDIIHSHLYVNDYILPIRTKNIKLIYTLHSDLSVLFGKNRKRHKIITSYCIRHKKMVPIAIQNTMKKEMDKMFNINTTVYLPNGINFNVFKRGKYNQTSVLQELNIKNDTFIIGHVGRFHPVKNHEFLIKVFQDFNKKNPNSHLLLIGSGDLEGRIKNKIRALNLIDNVSFLGEKENVARYMSVMDVFVLPSLHEGFGNVLIEAQLMGLKCVVSKNVPKETHVTKLVTALSLRDSTDMWIKEFKKARIEESSFEKLDKFNIKYVTENLENLYSGK